MFRDEFRMRYAATVFKQGLQDARARTVGYDNTDALLGHVCRRSVFRHHASAPSLTAFLLYVLAQIGAGGHLADEFRSRIIGQSGEDTVDIAQQNKRLGAHHLRNKSREFVVIGEHKLGDAHRVVFVDDGQYCCTVRQVQNSLSWSVPDLWERPIRGTGRNKDR